MFFLEISIVSLCLKYLVQSSKWIIEWRAIFLPVPEETSYSFLVYYFLDKSVSFIIIFLPVSTKNGFFPAASLVLSHLVLSKKETPKLRSSISMEILQRLHFLQSLSLNSMHLHVVWKITYIISRQIMSLKRMSSANFTILIWWSLICISLIYLLALMRSTSAAIMYKSIENRLPWQASCVKGERIR